MLLNFKIENFRSLRDAQQFDLRSVYRDHPPALNVAALYGANASGKSNILLALRFVHDAVIDQAGWNRGDRIHVTPFRLDELSLHKPTSFGLELLIEGVRYAYGFSATQERITEEWLHSYPKKKRRVLFEREGESYRFGPSFASAAVANLLKEITTPTSLYLTSAARAKQREAAVVSNWFRDALWFVNEEDSSRRMQRSQTQELLRDPAMARKVQRLVQAADLGISELRTEELEFTFEEDSQGLVEEGSFLVRTGSGGRHTVVYRGERPELTPGLRMLIESDLSVTFRHSGEVVADFSFGQESRGTQTWFDIAGPILNALDKGWTLVVDELDTSLHPLLLGQLIRLFQSGDSNPRGAQLLFTTHDASLMGRHGGEELLRRDEIWFTEKDHKTGATELYPLTDFKPRSGLNWEKRYLGGAVGAVPYISEEHFNDAVPGERHSA